jgi:hypothetical protein
VAITRAQIARWAEENDVEVIFFDPPEHFDHAILGVVHGFGQELAVVYDEEKVLTAMQEAMQGGLDREEAHEWFAFNTIGAYLGEATPRFLIRPWEEDPDVETT